MIPGNTFAYWISKKILKVFNTAISLSSITEPKSGLSTTDNNRFLRLWHEPL